MDRRVDLWVIMPIYIMTVLACAGVILLAGIKIFESVSF